MTINDNFFTGHFPTRPIMPGVLIVEALAQVGGIAMMDPDDPKENFFFGGIDACKFRKPVVPGDTLMLKVALKKMNKRVRAYTTSLTLTIGHSFPVLTPLLPPFSSSESPRWRQRLTSGMASCARPSSRCTWETEENNLV